MSAPEQLKVDDLSKTEFQAIQALGRGDADSYLQQLALQVIVNKLSRSQDLLYIPGDQDATTFINGRAFVGQQILKMLNIPIGKYFPEDNKEVTSDENKR